MSLLAFELPAFVIGLLFGSFLNVCISRLPHHRSIAKPRSRCPNCKQTIVWYDNIPLLSWLALRAKCRHCKVPILWRYPLVELAVGLWFAHIAADLGGLYLFPPSSAGGLLQFQIYLVGLLIFGFLLIGLIVMDWQTHRLPDAFTFPGILIGFLLVCTQAIFLNPGQMDIKLTPKHDLRLSSPGSFVAKGNVFLTGPEHLVFGRVVAIAGAALLLLAIRGIYKALRGQEGLGLGDVKLLAMIAAFLGFWSAMLALFLGLMACMGYALVLLARGKAHGMSRLPLGSFLAVGGLVAALFGDVILGWYGSFL